MEINIKNKVAIVTGGTTGMGEVISLGLLSEGCKVSICCKSEKNFKYFKNKYKKFSKNFYIEFLDATNEINISNFVKNTLNKFKKIDILVNNIGGDEKTEIKLIKPGIYDTFINSYNINFGTSLNFIVYTLPHMKKNSWGRVINISSISSLNLNKRIWYSNAKMSSENLIKYLATLKEYTNKKITFNSISPGHLNTKKSYLHKLKNKNKKIFYKEVEKRNPIGKLCEPEYILNLIIYLCSVKAEFINGSNIIVDGGENLIKS